MNCMKRNRMGGQIRACNTQPHRETLERKRVKWAMEVEREKSR